MNAARPSTIDAHRGASGDGADRAVRRLLAEIRDGLRHGYFEYTVRCEIIGQGRRRLVLAAGKTYQFVIPAADCDPTADGDSGSAEADSTTR